MKIDKDAELIAEAYKKSLIKEEFEEQMPDSRENAERSLPIGYEDADEDENGPLQPKDVARAVAGCLASNGKDSGIIYVGVDEVDRSKVLFTYQDWNGKRHNFVASVAPLK